MNILERSPLARHGHGFVLVIIVDASPSDDEQERTSDDLGNESKNNILYKRVEY